MEIGREVKIGSSENIILTSDKSLQSIRVSKMNIGLSSLVPFIECSSELNTISIGLYSINVKFDELGEYLYRIEFDDSVEYIKVKVVELTNTDMIIDLLEDISIKIENYEKGDDIVFVDILKYLKLINARI